VKGDTVIGGYTKIGWKKEVFDVDTSDEE